MHIKVVPEVVVKILFYDLLRVANTGTESSHISELIINFKNEGHEILLSNRIQTCVISNGSNSPPNTKLNIWGKIGNRWLLLNVILSLIGEVRFYLIGLFALTSRPDIVYYRHSMFNAGLWTANHLKIPALKEVNGIITNEFEVTRKASKLMLGLVNYIERKSMPKGNMIVTVTSKLKDVLINDYKVPEDKIVVLENGANTELFVPLNIHSVKKELGLDDKLRYVCYCGNFFEWQGLEYLIRCIPMVVKMCPDTYILLVGDGELKNKLIKIATDLNVIDRIIFAGMVPYKKVPLYINACDVCVTPKIPLVSGYSPLKLCEYLACEKPVVASNISGLEILEKYNMGILVPPEDEVGLAQAIIKLLKNDDLRSTLGKNGRRYVVENRSWEKVAKNVLAIMNNLVK